LAQVDALLMSCWNVPLLSENVPTAITFWGAPAAIVLFEGPTASALIVASETVKDVLPLWPRLAEIVAVPGPTASASPVDAPMIATVGFVELHVMPGVCVTSSVLPSLKTATARIW